MSRFFLKGTEQNWGCICEGCWSERVWEIRNDNTFIRTVSYVQGNTLIPEKVVRGEFSREDYERLTVLANEPWSDEKTDACDGSAWEFKAYGSRGELLKKRTLDYVYDIEPFESITAIFMKYDEYD